MAEAHSEFIILMYEDDQAWSRMPKERQAELLARYGEFVKALRAAERFVYGAPCGEPQILLQGGVGAILQATLAAGQNVLTGFFVIRAANLDEAVQLARGCPALTHGERVVVRPVGHA